MRRLVFAQSCSGGSAVVDGLIYSQGEQKPENCGEVLPRIVRVDNFGVQFRWRRF